MLIVSTLLSARFRFLVSSLDTAMAPRIALRCLLIVVLVSLQTLFISAASSTKVSGDVAFLVVSKSAKSRRVKQDVEEITLDFKIFNTGGRYACGRVEPYIGGVCSCAP